MASGIVPEQHIGCASDGDHLPNVFKKIQNCQIMEHSQGQMFPGWRLILQHLAHDLASVAAVLICWPHLQRRRGFTH